MRARDLSVEQARRAGVALPRAFVLWGAGSVAGLVLLAFPALAQALEWSYYLSLATKALILVLAASALNLVLGYGGLVSFGHATYYGLGAYTVAVLAREGVRQAWLVWPAAVAVAALAALAIGAVCLRTRGLYFIMITLAFAQMVYYFVVSFKQYGGQDGLRAPRTDFGLPLGDAEVYYLSLLLVAASLFFLWRLVHARFGRALQAARDNEVRATTVGFPVYRIQLVAFVISGALTGLAGALMAHHTQYVSPAMLSWPQSGHFMFMVILGGVGRFWAGLLGAGAMVLIEELFHSLTVSWQLYVGLTLLAVVLLAPRGLAGLVEGRRR
ncbi:MAG: branched-chain amino acid ABC transporter permease [Armatimonadota bacterium]|nr:branched-chain amino acid ABC transporter permease [Armatimonadota bacterium]MDR5676224.1 branched-chain amino acid ABC transporter permease [Armatimonadota bacterium]MDR5689567.1 branched-chain amino acid ABC transporter permease [Armatimonadota bacterium]MDR7386459.1 branched-chain amino acid ABC transporter permease [Armatimonadota bacterium]MDR7390273.1 branched-chain amino acid ABC transporter permease [Armatimonadota bacterium]